MVTSALPYANGHVHLGHLAGAYLPADIYVRYKRLRGQPTLYVCGSDEYGIAITLTALKENVSPEEVINRYHTANAESFARVRQSFDIYGRTSWRLHTDTTQAFFRRLYYEGHIEQREMELWYSEKSDTFLPDRYVKGVCPKCGYTEATGDECEHCGAQYATQELTDPRTNIPGDDSTPILRKSKHWFLNLNDFTDRLRKYVDSHPEWRANVRGIASSWVDDLRPRCITRDVEWGIPVPLEDAEAQNKRIYVWFDAPIGYVTNTRQWGIDRYNDEDEWRRWWKEDSTRLVHFMGKDNVPFHAVIFPAMLMGQNNYIVADQVVATEYLKITNRDTGQTEKGSKSKGNMISVRWFADRFSADAIRYYLCSIMPESSDSAFDWEEFMNRYNGELCDVIGNFVHRSLTMTVKEFDFKVPGPADFDDEDRALLDSLPERLDAVGEALDNFRFRQGLERFVDIGRAANRYFDAKEPWNTRKTDSARTATTLFTCCQVVRALCTAMAPFAPDGAHKLAHILGITLPEGGPKGGPDAWTEAKAQMQVGSPLKEPEVLFPKIEQETIDKYAQEHAAGKAI
jgi:methionyl-tRNA synthetase